MSNSFTLKINCERGQRWKKKRKKWSNTEQINPLTTVKSWESAQQTRHNTNAWPTVQCDDCAQSMTNIKIIIIWSLFLNLYVHSIPTPYFIMYGKENEFISYFFEKKLPINCSIKAIFYARGCYFTDLHFRDAKLWNEWFIKLPCDHSKAVSSRYTASTTYKNKQYITPKFVSQLIHPRWLLYHFHNLQDNFWWQYSHTSGNKNKM